MIVLFAKMPLAFNTRHFYLFGHNSSWQAERCTFLLKKKRRGTVNCWGGKLAWTVWSDTGQRGFETIRLYELKVKHVHNYFYVIRSWELSSLSDWTLSLVTGTGHPRQVGWEEHPDMVRQGFLEEVEQDRPSAEPKDLSCDTQGRSPRQGSPPPHNEPVGRAESRISPPVLLLLTVESCVYFPMTSQEVHGNISRYKIYSFSYL